MKRSEAREQVFLITFEKQFNDLSCEELISLAQKHRAAEFDKFAQDLINTVQNNLAHIDDIISKHSVAWKIDRLPKSTLAVLRVALAEIIYLKDVPVGASINEAVELAKKYASEEDASFINGILGVYVKDNNPEKTLKTPNL